MMRKRLLVRMMRKRLLVKQNQVRKSFPLRDEIDSLTKKIVRIQSN